MLSGQIKHKTWWKITQIQTDKQTNISSAEDDEQINRQDSQTIQNEEMISRQVSPHV